MKKQDKSSQLADDWLKQSIKGMKQLFTFTILIWHPVTSWKSSPFLINKIKDIRDT